MLAGCGTSAHAPSIHPRSQVLHPSASDSNPQLLEVREHELVEWNRLSCSSLDDSRRIAPAARDLSNSVEMTEKAQVKNEETRTNSLGNRALRNSIGPLIPLFGGSLSCVPMAFACGLSLRPKWRDLAPQARFVWALHAAALHERTILRARCRCGRWRPASACTDCPSMRAQSRLASNFCQQATCPRFVTLIHPKRRRQLGKGRRAALRDAVSKCAAVAPFWSH
jgi:hypothetical protein